MNSGFGNRPVEAIRTHNIGENGLMRIKALDHRHEVFCSFICF